MQVQYVKKTVGMILQTFPCGTTSSPSGSVGREFADHLHPDNHGMLRTFGSVNTLSNQAMRNSPRIALLISQWWPLKKLKLYSLPHKTEKKKDEKPEHLLKDAPAQLLKHYLHEIQSPILKLDTFSKPLTMVIENA